MTTLNAPAPAVTAVGTATALPVADASTPTSDPRHVFLTAREVHARYKRGRTAGYALTAAPYFPRPCGDVWRLDILMEFELRWSTGDVDPWHGPSTGGARAAVPAPRRGLEADQAAFPKEQQRWHSADGTFTRTASHSSSGETAAKRVRKADLMLGRA